MIDIETMVEPPAAEPLKPIFTPVDKVAEFPIPMSCRKVAKYLTSTLTISSTPRI